MSKSSIRLPGSKIGLLCAFCLVTALAAGAFAGEAVHLSDCMGFEQTAAESGAEYRLTNRCEQRVACTVTWTLSCGDAPPYRRINHSVNVNLAPSVERSITASASSCATESWEINNVTWSCRP